MIMKADNDNNTEKNKNKTLKITVVGGMVPLGYGSPECNNWTAGFMAFGKKCFYSVQSSNNTCYSLRSRILYDVP